MRSGIFYPPRKRAHRRRNCSVHWISSMKNVFRQRCGSIWTASANQWLPVQGPGGLPDPAQQKRSSTQTKRCRMNSNVSVELWLHPDKLSALKAALEREHSTLRDHLQSSLEELYRIWVPHEQRAELREKNFCSGNFRLVQISVGLPIGSWKAVSSAAVKPGRRTSSWMRPDG